MSEIQSGSWILVGLGFRGYQRNKPNGLLTYYHQTHKNGKWCWLPSEIEELKRQKAAGMTFNDVSKVSYIFPCSKRRGLS